MDLDLGKKVRMLRKRRGLKQDDLANLLLLSKGQIANLENGRRNLSIKQLAVVS